MSSPFEEGSPENEVFQTIMNFSDSFQAQMIFGRGLDLQLMSHQLRLLQAQQAAEQQRLKRIHNRKRTVVWFYKVSMMLCIIMIAQEGIENCIETGKISIFNITIASIVMGLVSLAILTFWKVELAVKFSLILFWLFSLRVINKLLSESNRPSLWYLRVTHIGFLNTLFSITIQLTYFSHLVWFFSKCMILLQLKLSERRAKKRKFRMLGILPRISSEEICDSELICCPICLEDMTENDDIVKLSDCFHVSHFECLRPWVVAHKKCPICRTPISALAGRTRI